MNLRKRNLIISVCLVVIAGLLPHCADLSKVLNQMNIQKPIVEVSDAKLTGLSFDHVDLLFGIDVKNPNSVGVAMDGFDYDFLLNDNSFISGNKSDKLDIEARGTSRVDFPVSLKFSDIYNTFSTLINEDTTTYEINLGLLFNLPVLGSTRIPVSHNGVVPIPKLPSIKVHQLKLDRITLTGAQLSLKVAVDNPNAFAMMFDQLNYNFSINGLNWVSGKSSSTTKINEKGEGIVSIPVSLDFLTMGRSVYNLINGTSELNYKFNGDMDVSSTVSLLGKHTMPFDHSGTIKLNK